MKQITSLDELEEALSSFDIKEDQKKILRSIINDGWKPEYSGQLQSDMIQVVQECPKCSE